MANLDQPINQAYANAHLVAISTGGIRSGTTAAENIGTITRVGDAGTTVAGDVLVGTGTLVSSVGGVLGSTGKTTPVGGLTGTIGGVVGKVGSTVTGVGTSAQQDGLSGLPVVGPTVANVAGTTDSVLNPLAKVTVASNTLIGNSNPTSAQLIGASGLSSGPPAHSALQVGVLSNNQVVALGVAGHPVVGDGGIVPAVATGSGLPAVALSGIGAGAGVKAPGMASAGVGLGTAVSPVTGLLGH
jgi:hypothetical protein